MPDPILRLDARQNLSPDLALSAVMAAITRESRASGLSIAALGAMVADHLAANLVTA